MPDEIAISVQNLTKIYKLYNSPKDRLKEALHPLRKKYHHDFYALNNVSFEVKKGETVGIVGRNGSGKSTLLKVITGVLTPSSGSVSVNGKISALLELGAGFNPELTGIENVYFNGTLMGFNKKDMDAKIDDILSFADIGEFVYQPVKTYSSGMFVRLAFAVQALIEPDILIVDEALAVGDSLFQKRCYQKMEELIQKGTTLLFVSHDQESVRTLTNHAVLLKDGLKYAEGKSSEVVLEYRKLLHKEETAYLSSHLVQPARKTQPIILPTTNNNESPSDLLRFGDREIAELVKIRVMNDQYEEANVFYPREIIRISIKCKVHVRMTHLNVGIRIRNKEGVKVYSWGTLNQDISVWSGRTNSEVFWEKSFEADQDIEVHFQSECNLGSNFYEIQAFVSEENDKYYGAHHTLDWLDEAAFFEVRVDQKDYYFGGVCDMQMITTY